MGPAFSAAVRMTGYVFVLTNDNFQLVLMGEVISKYSIWHSFICRVVKQLFLC